MKNLLCFLSTLIIVLVMGISIGILIIPIWFFLRSESNYDGTEIRLEENNDICYTECFVDNGKSDISIRDAVVNYIEDLGIEDCESSVSKIKTMISEGSEPIVIGDDFRVLIQKNSYPTFQVPYEFNLKPECKFKIIENLLMFEMCITQHMEEEELEDRILKTKIKDLAKKLAHQSKHIDYEPIICV